MRGFRTSLDTMDALIGLIVCEGNYGFDGFNKSNLMRKQPIAVKSLYSPYWTSVSSTSLADRAEMVKLATVKYFTICPQFRPRIHLLVLYYCKPKDNVKNCLLLKLHNCTVYFKFPCGFSSMIFSIIP